MEAAKKIVMAVARHGMREETGMNRREFFGALTGVAAAIGLSASGIAIAPTPLPKFRILYRKWSIEGLFSEDGKEYIGDKVTFYFSGVLDNAMNSPKDFVPPLIPGMLRKSLECNVSLDGTEINTTVVDVKRYKVA